MKKSLLWLCGTVVSAAFVVGPVMAEEDAAPAADAAAVPEERTPLRVQVLLDRARFSPGEIDGAVGSNQQRAVAAFQRARDLADSGELDDATWDALEKDAVPTLVEVTLTAEDVAGPFVEIPADMEEKAKLETLGYRDVAEKLGERFHAAPALLRSLNEDKEFAAGETIRVPNIDAGAELPKAAKVVVDASDLSAVLLDADGGVIARFPATIGSEHDPLPVGDWKINGVATDPVFHYNPELFWDADPSHGKAKIAGGPNNPVGRAWVDLSKPHYGIHGTPEPSRISKSESHGCIRLTNWDVLRLAKAVAPGTPVTLQD